MASSGLARRRARVCGAGAEVAMRCATKSALARLVGRVLAAVWAAVRSTFAKGTRALLTGASLSRNGTLPGVFPVSRKRRAATPPYPPPHAGEGREGVFRIL